MSDEEKSEWSNIKSLHKDRFLDSKQTTFDIDNLHPEARRRLQMLGFLTIDDKGEQQEVTDEEVDAILLKRRRTEEPDIIADKYMMHHGLYELFKTLTTKMVLDRPADPVGFIITDLEKRSKDKGKS